LRRPAKIIYDRGTGTPDPRGKGGRRTDPLFAFQITTDTLMHSRFETVRLLLPALFVLAVLASGCDVTDNEQRQDTTDPNPGPFRVDQTPAWSPDGSRILYHHDAGRTEDTTDVSGLYILNLETDSTRLLVEGSARSPDWRADGERIAFTTGNVYTIRPDGSDLQQVTDHGSAFFPSWAPNGTRLAYDATSLPQSGIWLVNSDGSGRRNLGFGRDADWGPSGKRLVFQWGPETDSEDQIWMADTSRTDSTKLTANNFVINRHPVWSPNGQWVAWVAADGPEDEPPCQLQVMRSDGSDVETVAACAIDPIGWGPDSERLVFSKSARDSDLTALWTIRRDGSNLRQITTPSRNPLNE
jgi:TolB protein